MIDVVQDVPSYVEISEDETVLRKEPELPPVDIRHDPRFAPYRVLPEREFNAISFWASTFYPFQRDWLLEPAEFAISNKSRQIGSSHTTGAVATLWGAFHGDMTTIVSKGDRESVEVLDKCKRHARVLQGLGSKMAETEKSNNNEIIFRSGGRILALPASGGRGFTGNVFLDEFAYQEHAVKVWDAAAPVALLGYKIRVVSTPNGIGNEFFDQWDIATNDERFESLPDEAKLIRWVPHLIPIDLAISQGYPVDIGRCWAIAKGDPRLFAQMFKCSFLDNVLQYIPGDVIQSCTTTAPWKTEPGDFYAGLDIGREADLTCLIVLFRPAAPGHPSRVVHIEVMKRTDSDGLEAMIDRCFEKYAPKRLCIDETGLGSFPVDRIKKKHSERIEVSHRRPRVEGVMFTPTSKEALATGLYTAMTDQRVILPADDRALPSWNGIDSRAYLTSPRQYTVNAAGAAKKLQSEIASVRRVITTAGNVQYTTPRTSDGHGDRAWALMLALFASSTINPMIAALQARTLGITPSR